MNSETKIWRRYLTWACASFLVVLAICSAVNLLVDPLDIFDSRRIAGVNAIKPHLDHHQVLSKARVAGRMCSSVGIFGNSRAEIGFDPDHPLFHQPGMDAYNHAIPGSALITSLQQLAWLEKSACAPKVIILGVEFFDFLGAKKSLAPRVLEPVPAITAPVLAETVFSITAVRDSIATLWLQRAEYPEMVTRRGFNPLLTYILEAKNNGYYALFRQRADENKKNWMRRKRWIMPPVGGVSEDTEDLDQFLAIAARSGAKVHIVIYPYHAQIRLMMEKLGLSPLYDEWRNLLVATAAKHAKGKAEIDIYDFSALTPETLEAIPARGDRRTELKYYWEAGHFKKALGDMVLQQVVAGTPGFGSKLDSASMSAWLQEDRQRIQRKLETNDALVQEVGLVIGQTGR